MDSNKRERRELERQQMEADWKAVLNQPAGRRVLANLLKACGTFGAVPLGGPEINAFNMGKRAVGDFIVSQVMAAAPDTLNSIYKRGYEHE